VASARKAAANRKNVKNVAKKENSPRLNNKKRPQTGPFFVLAKPHYPAYTNKK
jgi:hypothetical protein